MASYNVDFKLSVHKDFRRLPKSVVERVMKRIEKLKDEPFPHGVDKLEGVERLYRIVVGDYRIVYEVDTQAKQIMILYVRHRREVYRAL
ncbi:MAG: type II toxin-antitoxin system RelE/ParE family toxin [Anaerolineales bacterium]|nr:type II toxin-antitoxin system RelE/ParE family toxin [Anaerolineales bacterium]